MINKNDFVRLLSPPSCLWNLVTLDQWKAFTDEEQDKLIEAAKIITPITNYNPLAWPDQKVEIKTVNYEHGK